MKRVGLVAIPIVLIAAMMIMAIVLITTSIFATGCGKNTKDEMGKIFENTAELRGLPLAEGVSYSFVSPEEMREALSPPLAEEGLREIESLEAMYYFLGFLEDGEEGYEAQLEFEAENYFGLYFPEDNKFFVLGEELGPEEKLTVAHEYTHALTYQYLDFASLEEEANGNEDILIALESLLEGDAILLEFLYYDFYLSNEEREELMEMDAEYSYEEAIFSFPHELGPNFVGYIAGDEWGIDWMSVDKLYDNPPQSTEHILHPEKYLDGDMPKEVEMPNLATVLGQNWQEQHSNAWGEFGFLEYFAQFDGSLSVDAAAEGWGGDSFVFFENETTGEQLFVSSSVWDSVPDASEVFDFLVNNGVGTDLQWEGTRHVRDISWTSSGQVFHLAQKGDKILFVIGEEEDTVAVAVSAF